MKVFNYKYEKTLSQLAVEFLNFNWEINIGAVANSQKVKKLLSNKLFFEFLDWSFNFAMALRV